MPVIASYGFRPHRSRLPTSSFTLALYPCCTPMLPRLCAHLPKLLAPLFSVRPFVVRSVDRGPFGRCSRSIPSHLGTYLSHAFACECSAKTKPPTIIPHPVLSACLPITPTRRYRGGSVAFVLASVEFVPFGSRSRLVRSRQSPIIAAAAGIDPAKVRRGRYSAVIRPLLRL